MSIRQIIFAVAVLVVLGVASIMVLDQSWEGAGSGVGDKVLADVPVNDITKIVIQQKDKTATLEKVDGVWSVVEKEGYAADFQRISSAVLLLRDLKVAKVINAAPEAYGRLELDDQRKTLVTCFDKTHGVVAKLSLGKEAVSKRQPPQQMYFGGSSNGRYVLADKASPVLVSDSLYQLSSEPFSWVDRQFIALEKVKRIQMKSDWGISREDENGDFSFQGAVPEKKEVDSTKLNALASAFDYLTFEDVKKPAGEKVDQTLEVETFDGFVYTFDFVKAKGDKFVKISVKGNFVETRQPDKDEKPEEAVKLDKKFADNLIKLKEKLAKEQNVSNWLYKFSSSKNESILKTRDDLLKDKEEKKAVAEEHK